MPYLSCIALLPEGPAICASLSLPPLHTQEEEEGDEDSMTFWTAEELPDNDPTVLRASSWRHPAIVSAGAGSHRCSFCTDVMPLCPAMRPNKG